MGISALDPLSKTESLNEVFSESPPPNTMDEIVSGIAQKAFQNMDLSPSDPLDPSRVTVETNPSVDATNLVLEFQQRAITLLNRTEKTTKQILGLTDKLLDLSYEINALPKNDKIELGDKAKAILDELREKGINILDENKTSISKEEMLELKSIISAQIDQSRTKVQQIFTKMQSIIQDMMSVNDSGKKIISEFAQFMRTILKNMRPS